MKHLILSILAITLTTAPAFSSQKSSKKKAGCSQYENSWQQVDEYVHASPNGTPTLTYPVGMYVSKNPAGKVYVSGVSLDNSNGQYVIKNIIRRSTNFGNTWNTSNFIYDSETGSAGIRILEAPRHNKLLFLSEHHIFASSDLGNSFTEIANLAQQFPQYTNVLAVDAVVHNNTIYLVADGKSTVNGYNNWRGLVLKSNDNGVTWSLVKEFNKGDANRTWLTSVVVDSNGKVAVGGYALNGSSYYWLVYKSNSSVSSWTELETQLAPGMVISYVRALAFNEDDELLALGPIASASGISTYIRRYKNSASTVYQSAPGLIGTDLFLAENRKIYFPYTQNGFARMAVSSNDGDSWNETWSTIDNSTYSYEMGEDSKNNLYMTSQDGSTLKTYKLECRKKCD